MPDSGPRRMQAWTGSRASLTFSPGMNPARLSNGPQAQKDSGAFPPLSQSNGNRPSDAERTLQALTGLIGTTVTLSTKTSQRYEGVVASTGGEGDTTGITLKDVKEISSPGSPLKDQIFIASTNIDVWSSGPADAKALNGDSFKTDTDISQKVGARRERELTAWPTSGDAPSPPANATFGALGDEATFGPGAVGPNGTWDQFAVNEKLFGVKTNFDEDLYTTKLDRNAADFKERERKAQQIANEIMGSSVSNAHVREERTMDHVDDNGTTNEEDKYAGVVRSANAYVPPGARKAAVSVPVEDASKLEVPKVSINAPDGSTVTPTVNVSSAKGSSTPTKPSADPVPAFRDFVTTEKQRLTQKKQALMKNERDKRMADFLKFSQNFKLKKPIPDDLVPILAKDEDKQRLIREKTTQDASSDSARAIGQTSSATTPSPSARVQPPVSAKLPANATGVKMAGTVSAPKATTTTKGVDSPVKRSSLFIQAIPPFKGRKTSPTPPSNDTPASPTTGRLNVNASSFKPNPKAVAFTPSASPANATGPSAANVSPKPKSVEPAPSKPNPFFGNQITKKISPVHIKDDFNPFKYHKVVEPAAVSAMWPYNGKRYMQMFPAPTTPAQQQSPHMAPPVPPPMPPPSYEEVESNQQNAAAQSRGYVYAYPPYYPGQPIMPGMAHPPPGAYMPSPYMHPMHYQHTMPPPNGMYPSPSMGQMPPPGAYMPPPPPPGTYAPPPNSGGPRPSMPPTPIPAHAHPYYAQSPQLQHAVPYPMMMQPGQHIPHPYEGGQAPPVPMGGVGHA